MAFELDIENKSKNYLDEKELFILYYLLKNKRISTLWSNVFVPNNKIEILSKPNSTSDEIWERLNHKGQTVTVVNYLLGLGKMLDKKGFSMYGNADYSLVEGGFLTDDFHNEMYNYLELPEGKRLKDKKLNTEQKKFLEDIISGKLDLNDIEVRVKFTKLANPPIKAYQEAILNKNAEKDFIELVNKLIKEYDGGKWNTEDIERFLEIWYAHNKKNFREKTLNTNEGIFYEDYQQKLGRLIFENVDIHLKIENTTKLENYLKEYINLFKNNELDKLSNNGLTGNFFTTSRLVSLNYQLWGFKKQKEVLVEHIEKNFNEYMKSNLDITHPYLEPTYEGDTDEGIMKIKMSSNEDEADKFLFVHTMMALEFEKFLEVKNILYGYMNLFDLYNRGFVFKVKLPTKEKVKQKEGKIKKDKNIKEIVFVEKNTKPKPTYIFYINNDLDDIKKLRNDSSRLRKLINIIKGNNEDFDKSLLDYINSNINCAIYCGGKYNLTKVIEEHGNIFRVCYGIKAKVISELEYKKKINKKNRT